MSVADRLRGLADRLALAEGRQVKLMCGQCGRRQLGLLEVGFDWRADLRVVVDEWGVGKSARVADGGRIVATAPSIVRRSADRPDRDLDVSWSRRSWTCHKRCGLVQGERTRPAGHYVIRHDTLAAAFVKAVEAGRTTIVAGEDI